LIVDALDRRRHLSGDRAGRDHRSARRGLARTTSAPTRAASWRAIPAAIASIAPQARTSSSVPRPTLPWPAAWSPGIDAHPSGRRSAGAGQPGAS